MWGTTEKFSPPPVTVNSRLFGKWRDCAPANKNGAKKKWRKKVAQKKVAPNQKKWRPPKKRELSSGEPEKIQAASVVQVVVQVLMCAGHLLEFLDFSRKMNPPVLRSTPTGENACPKHPKKKSAEK